MENILEEPEGKYDENRDFTTLICWKDARLVKLFFYQKILPLLPGDEKLNLDNQIRKASVSTRANISEGYGRFHYQEGLQFYRISKGSLYELKDHLMSCHDFTYVDKNLYEQGINLIEKAKISLNGYISYVKSKNTKLH